MQQLFCFLFFNILTLSGLTPHPQKKKQKKKKTGIRFQKKRFVLVGKMKRRRLWKAFYPVALPGITIRGVRNGYGFSYSHPSPTDLQTHFLLLDQLPPSDSILSLHGDTTSHEPVQMLSRWADRVLHPSRAVD